MPQSDSSPHSSLRLLVQFNETYCSLPELNNILENKFSFNGETYCLGPEINWLKNPSEDIEWLILLHKFYAAPGLIRQWLTSENDKYLNIFLDLVTTWIKQVPDNFIATDVTARRVQNWAYAWNLIDRADRISALPEEFVNGFKHSIQNQVNAIITNMAPSRNHRTLELYSVFLSSLAFPDLAQAPDWRRLATEQMVLNIRSDLQADGVHCEQSTDYHHLALRSYLLFYQLAKLNEISIPQDISTLLCRALDFSMHIHRPDGLIPAISDSDSAEYIELLSWGAELFSRTDYAYVASAGIQGQAPFKSNVKFSDSGYVVMRSNWSNSESFDQARYLVLDAGPVGQGNHGHMDALSIEIAAYGRSLIVDPGRYTYNEKGIVDWRSEFRSTRAHNTVTVDDRNQAIYRRKRPGSKFKIVAPHPKTSIVRDDLDSEPSFVQGHVVSPNYAPQHHRFVCFVRQCYWLIIDRLMSDDMSEHDYKLRYQLTPTAINKIQTKKTPNNAQVSIPGLELWVAGQENMQFHIEDSWVSVDYGVKQPAPRLCFSQHARETMFMSALIPQKTVQSNSVHINCFRSSESAFRLSLLVDGQLDDWQWLEIDSEIQLTNSAGTRSWNLDKNHAL
ncbi:MAG: alginate lyase family protein [Burkholderiaceae bacterium]